MEYVLFVKKEIQKQQLVDTRSPAIFMKENAVFEDAK